MLFQNVKVTLIFLDTDTNLSHVTVSSISQYRDWVELDETKFDGKTASQMSIGFIGSKAVMVELTIFFEVKSRWD